MGKAESMDTRLMEYKREQQLMEWARRIGERQESGVPIEKWCQEQGISRQTYYRWQKRVFEAAQRQQQVEFAEVKASVPAQAAGNRGKHV